MLASIRKQSLLLLMAVMCSSSIATVEAFQSPTRVAKRSSISSKPAEGGGAAISNSRSALSVLFRPDDDKSSGTDGGTSIGANNYMPTPLEVTCDPNFPCVEDDLRQGTWLERYGESLVVFGIPGITPFVAFLGFDHVAAAFHWIAEQMSSNNWVSVDGGAYQARIIAPAINGVVIPSVALLLATLTSTTITTLRQRQVDVRQAINLEAAELRAIECLLDSVSEGPVQDQCRDYVSETRRESCEHGWVVLVFCAICSPLFVLLLFAVDPIHVPHSRRVSSANGCRKRRGESPTWV